jgi:hypothetical protein
MEGWSDSFVRGLEEMVNDVEKFLADVIEEVNSAIEVLVDVSEDWVDQFQQTTVGMENSLNSLIDPILEAYLGFEVTLENTIQPITHTIDPLLNNHTACVGCRNYHGQAYGGTLLVCGMHPYGWEGEKCPDWESSWQDS